MDATKDKLWGLEKIWKFNRYGYDSVKSTILAISPTYII